MKQRRTRRGQAYALEGIIAALVVATSVLVGLQVVHTTPWTVGTSETLSEQRQTLANDLLVAGDENGTLSRTVRCVDTSGQLNPAVHSETVFGQMVDRTLGQRGFSYRLSFAYWDGSAGEQTEIAVEEADTGPSGDVVTATRTVVLTDGMNTFDINDDSVCAPRDDTLEDNTDFYISNTNSSSAVYNVVEVRLDVWKGGSS